MEIYEITGNQTGVSREGVNFLQPSDSFTEIIDGFVHRQVLQSRKGIALYGPRLAGDAGFERVTGIFEHILPSGTRELLVTDQNYLYKYNTGTGNFDQIPFAGSIVAYAGFALADNANYVSGTSYPTKDNSARFVFTCDAMSTTGTDSGIFFYDGTDVKCFTDAADNADYAKPPEGDLLRAKHVLWMNERLNLIVPQLNTGTLNQGIAFTGIRTSSGNGDKFNVSGSGIIQLDTFESIQGASILADVMALELDRSSWVLEKTTDVFNPWRPRKLPSVIGTDAPFSFAQWDGKVVTMGRTGMISHDTYSSLRIDNKIPYFTQDEIEGKFFDYCYGGFDRENAQFLFSYVSSVDNHETQDHVLVYNYEEQSWSVFNLPLTVFGQTEVGRELTWNDIDETTNPPNASWARWDTTEEIWNRIGVTASTQKTLAGDDQGFVYELNRDYDDQKVAITFITKASQAVLTVSESNFQVGDLVAVENVEGMTEINNYNSTSDNNEFNPWVVVAATSTSVTLNALSSNWGTYTQNGTLSKCITFSAKTNPFNPYREQGKKCYISSVEFLINSDGGKLYVDVFMDGETSPFKKDILCKPSDTSKDRNWVTLTVDNEADFFTFQMRFVDPGSHVELTSMRLHVAPGGLTSG